MNAAFENPHSFSSLPEDRLWGFLRFGMCRCKHRFSGLYIQISKRAVISRGWHIPFILGFQ